MIINCACAYTLPHAYVSSRAEPACTCGSDATCAGFRGLSWRQSHCVNDLIINPAFVDAEDAKLMTILTNPPAPRCFHPRCRERNENWGMSLQFGDRAPGLALGTAVPGGAWHWRGTGRRSARREIRLRTVEVERPKFARHSALQGRRRDHQSWSHGVNVKTCTGVT